MQKLDVNNAKDKDEFVKNEIPKLVFQVLLLRNAEFTKDQLLNRLAQQDQTTICHINDSLE